MTRITNHKDIVAARAGEPEDGAGTGSESAAGHAPWTAERVLASLADLGPLRIITVTGPNVFETICELEGYGVANGYFNAITPGYHWHLRLDGLRHVQTKDETHARSGRRVLFLELRENARAEPFLRIYLHRGKGEGFGADREAAFGRLHAAFAGGAALESAAGETTS